MTIAVDDLFDATLSTILHASMEMCGRTKRTTDELSLSNGDESGKFLKISRFKHQKSPKHLCGPIF
ncbi:hypothetical protein ACEQ6A_26535 [Rhizobium brockwellii]|uniref:hypothetical protein n=1 Tax=Rhizobium brockwellii TaxID=3019932 RepID=UPI003F9CD51A